MAITRRTVCLGVLASVAFLCSSAAEAGVIRRVKVGGGAGPGSNWGNAYGGLQDSLGASASGDEIWVAAGTYTGNFALVNGTGLYGGFNGTESTRDARDWTSNVTTLSGNNSGTVVSTTGADAGTIIDGFTITGGNAGTGGGLVNNPSSSPTISNCTFSGNTATYGGGIWNSISCTPAITDCIFSGNTATYGGPDGDAGGAMYNYHGGNPTIMNCTFRANTAPNGSGGAIYNWDSSPILYNCSFSGNTANRGGGGMFNNAASNPSVTSCIFSTNTAGFGAAMNNTASSPIVTGCTFSGNTATSNCGGMYNTSASSPTLRNCTFNGNNSSGHCGGLYNNEGSNPTLANCVFSRNSANGYGGGVLNDGATNGARPTLTNCTFTGNTASGCAGGMCSTSNAHPTVTNCIFWGDSSEIADIIGSSTTITFSDIQGGGGSINADPRFVRNPGSGNDYGNLRLQSSSPCINVGNNAADIDSVTGGVQPLPGTDLDGNTRIIPGGGTVDMGAFELPDANESRSRLYIAAAATGAYTGHDWANAYATVQDALNVAEAYSDVTEVWVAAGTYKADHGSGQTLGDRAATFRLRNSLALYGGFAGTESSINDRDWTTNVTTLSGDLYGDDLPNFTNRNDNTANVVTVGIPDNGGNFDSVIFDGFTVGGGFAKVTDAHRSGAGWNNTRSAFNGGEGPVVSNCTFRENSAATDSGGGMLNVWIGIRVFNSTFIGNRADDGAGIYFNGLRSPTLTNCVFTGNTATGGGGAIHSNSCTPTITNCLIYGNTAARGNGMWSCCNDPTLTNCTFADNPGGISVIYGVNSCNAHVRNCIFYNNGVPHFGGAANPDINYTCLEGGYSGSGNVNASNFPPLFVFGPGGAYYLSQTDSGQGSNSPCVDTGSGSGTDLGQRTTRTSQDVDSNTIDMGYHYPVLPICTAPTVSSIDPNQGTNEGPVNDVSITGDDFSNNGDSQGPVSGLVAYWPLDEAGGTTVTDISGNQYDGTATGTSIVSGKFGNARSFNGGGDYVLLPSATTVLGSDPRTYSSSFWFKTTTQTYSAIVTDYNGWNDSDFGISLWTQDGSNNLEFCIRHNSGAGGCVVSAADTSNDQWHHVAMVVDRDALTLNAYLDGNHFGSTLPIGDYNYIGASPTNIYLGCDFYQFHPNQYFSGEIDEVRIYNRALSADDIRQLAGGIDARLRKTGEADIVGSGFTFASPTSLTGGSFNLAGAAAGLWDVVVTNPCGQSGILPEGFTVLPAPTGSCCYSDGSCEEDTTQAHCQDDNGGTWTYGGNCNPNTCPQPAACCFDGYCQSLLQADCGNAGGSYRGDGTLCDSTPCPPLCNLSSMGGPIQYCPALTSFRGDLYAGGFNNGNYPFARWISDTNWEAINFPGAWEGFYAFAQYGDDLIIGGGIQNDVASPTLVYISRWDGADFWPMGTGADGPVTALQVYNGELVAGGSFNVVGGAVNTSHIARWNGITWSSLGSGMNSSVAALTIHDGKLIAAGGFTRAGGISANRVAAWDGQSWQPLGTGLDDYVQALASYNGDLFAGGYFVTAGGAPANRIARWDGAAWQPMGDGLNDLVTCFQVFNNDLVVGGYFSADGTGSISLNHLVRWDGNALSQFGPGIAANVYTLTAAEQDLIMSGDQGIFRWHCPSRPNITQQPAEQIVCLDGAASFSVTVDGYGPFTYQWRKHGRNLGDDGRVAGATEATLTINPVNQSDVGVYDVVVASEYGEIASDLVSLTINMPECTITADTAACGDTSNLAASVPDAGPNATYQWTVTDGQISGDPPYGPQISFTSGGGGSVTLDVQVTNATGCSASCQKVIALEFTWQGSDGGQFQDAANWTPQGWNSRGRSHGSAVLTNSGASSNRCVLTAGGDAVCGVTISATGSGLQILEIPRGASLTASGDVTVSTNGELRVVGGSLAGSGSLVNDGSTKAYGEILCDLENTGSFEVTTVKSLDLSGASFLNSAGGIMRTRPGAGMHVAATAVAQGGEIAVHTNATVSFDTVVSSSTGGLITLLGGSLAAPALSNNAGALITGFGTIDGDTTNDGNMVAIANMQVVGDLTNNGTITVQSGILTVTGDFHSYGTFIGGFGGRAGGDPTGLTIRGDFDVVSTDFRGIDLGASTIQMAGETGGDTQHLEVLATDAGHSGVALPDATLFSIGTLRIGPAQQALHRKPVNRLLGPAASAMIVQLVDNHRNSASDGREALYVEQLILEPGVTLDLAGLRLYYGTASPADPQAQSSAVRIIDSIGGGALSRLAHDPRRLDRAEQRP